MVKQSLNHEFIIKYLDSFLFESELYIITEYADKGDLKKLIRAKKESGIGFTENTIFEYIYQISAALIYMHDKRVIHRDLKPANIFISNNETLKVGDLGLSRAFSSDTTHAFTKVGTPLYMSPELIEAEGYDGKTDVWSLGCIAYELSEMRSPFRDEGEKMNLMELFNKIKGGHMDQMINTDISAKLKGNIKEMLCADKNKRPNSLEVFKKAKLFITDQQAQFTPIDVETLSEEIFDMLLIIDANLNFLKPLQIIGFNKYYFMTKDNEIDKFWNFYRLCHWLIQIDV